MTTLTVTLARTRLYSLLDEVALSHEPMLITGKRSNGVLISADDWRAIQETLFLSAIPGMKASIVKGMSTPVSKCSKEIEW